MSLCNAKRLYVVLSSVLILLGCGDRAVQVGHFIDAVEGVAWRTDSLSGITDLKGRFEYKVGERVTFSIGAVILGSAEGEKEITPVELANAEDIFDDHVINIARLLLSLDKGLDPSNGIEVTTVVTEAAVIPIDFAVDRQTFEQDQAVIDLVASAQVEGEVSRSLVSVNTTLDYLGEILDSEQENQAPIANAGQRQEGVQPGDRVRLEGEATDPGGAGSSQGAIVDFSWKQKITGEEPVVDLIHPNSNDVEDMEDPLQGFEVEFIAPDVTQQTELTFEFSVTDDEGLTDVDEVIVVVEPN